MSTAGHVSRQFSPAEYPSPDAHEHTLNGTGGEGAGIASAREQDYQFQTFQNSSLDPEK